jgi:ADP-heptose:LPS heptosyltransferase
MAQARAMNARRSLPLARLAPLAAVPGVQFVSLQWGGADEAAASGIPLFDPMAWIEDFDDTAALVTCLDLVIAVDTAVAHVAGALGRPVWVMSRYDACWRWLAGRSDSPWYPTLRLYRQSQPGDWDGVVAEAVRDLYGMVASSTKQERLLF